MERSEGDGEVERAKQDSQGVRHSLSRSLGYQGT